MCAPEPKEVALRTRVVSPGPVVSDVSLPLEPLDCVGPARIVGGNLPWSKSGEDFFRGRREKFIFKKRYGLLTVMRIIFRVPMETMHVFLVPSDSMP